MKLLAAVLAACMTIAVPLVSAAAADGRPSEIPASIKAEAPQGTGKLSRLMITAYDAALWYDGKQWSYDAPFALSLRYHMGFDSEELVDRTITEMKQQATVPEKDESEYRAQLTKAFPNVKDGDRITAVFIPPRTTRFYYNSEPTREVVDATFAPRFFDIWLSEKTSEPSLRRALLKQ